MRDRLLQAEQTWKHRCKNADPSKAGWMGDIHVHAIMNVCQQPRYVFRDHAAAARLHLQALEHDLCATRMSELLVTAWCSALIAQAPGHHPDRQPRVVERQSYCCSLAGDVLAGVGVVDACVGQVGSAILGGDLAGALLPTAREEGPVSAQVVSEQMLVGTVVSSQRWHPIGRLGRLSLGPSAENVERVAPCQR